MEIKLTQRARNQINAENTKLSQMLSVICENYNALQNHVMRLMSENPAKVFNASKKRKAESIDDSQKRERK